MPGKAHEVLQQLAKERAEIDNYDGGEFSSPSYEGYEAAQRELRQLEPSERAKLAEGLTDPNRAIRIQAARALEHLGLTQARPELERGLADSELDVRDACAEALAKVAPASALPAISERGAAVSTHVLKRCANAAVEALGAKALPWVVKSGLSPKDGKEAWAALYSLDREGTSKALERALTRDDVSWDWVLGVSELVRERGEWGGGVGEAGVLRARAAPRPALPGRRRECALGHRRRDQHRHRPRNPFQRARVE